MVRQQRSDAGVTLIELLVTVAILGIAFGTILTGVSGMYDTNDRDRKLAYAETWVRRYAEDVDAATYVPCATASSYQSGLSAAPTGYTVTLAVKYWNGSIASPSFGS